MKHGLRSLFDLGQRMGVDILPRHFYSEIPDMRHLRRDGSWKLARGMLGILGADTDEQFAFVEECCRPKIVARVRDVHAQACVENGTEGYGPIEADFLFCFLNAKRPGKIVQVGCGVATAVVLRALQESGYCAEVVCIEPYPTPFLRRADREGRVRLLPHEAQHVPLEELTCLGHGGLLFIDSTHAVRPGSEVNRIVLDVLPRLAPGSWVHFHDVYFPYDYSRDLLRDALFFGNESVLLQAFLTQNPHYVIRASLSMLHYADPARLQRYLPKYCPAGNDHGLAASEGHFPSSIYLQVID